jgi:hypothetical protein
MKGALRPSSARPRGPDGPELVARAFLGAVLACSPVALADVPPEKAAQAAFDQGMELMKKKKLAEACPKFEESQRLDPGMGTAFRLAECYEGIGRMAKAWALYHAVAEDAQAKKNRAREVVARKHAEAVEPKLGRMTVVVSVGAADTPGLALTRDGDPIARSEWGAPVRVDADEHVVRASAPHKKAWETRTTKVLPGTNVDVVVPALEDEGAAKGASDESGAKPPHPASSARRPIAPAIVLGAAAAVGVGLGVTGMVLYSGQHGTASDLQASLMNNPSACAGASPPAACVGLRNAWGSATTFENLGLWGFVGGGVAGVATLVYVLLPVPKTAPTTGGAVRVVPEIGRGRSGALVSGSF